MYQASCFKNGEFKFLKNLQKVAGKQRKNEHRTQHYLENTQRQVHISDKTFLLSPIVKSFTKTVNQINLDGKDANFIQESTLGNYN